MKCFLSFSQPSLSSARENVLHLCCAACCNVQHCTMHTTYFPLENSNHLSCQKSWVDSRESERVYSKKKHNKKPIERREVYEATLYVASAHSEDFSLTLNLCFSFSSRRSVRKPIKMKIVDGDGDGRRSSLGNSGEEKFVNVQTYFVFTVHHSVMCTTLNIKTFRMIRLSCSE